MSGEYSLELKNLRKQFGKTDIIRGVDLAVKAGERVAIIGPNGAGNGPLYDTTGSPMAGVTTAAVSGAILGIPNFNFNTVTPTAGQYWIGIACTLAGANTRYWATNLTIDGSGAYSFGWLPNAPVLTSPLTVHDVEIDGSFTISQVPQAVTGFTVTAHPAAGSDVTMTLASGATSFVMKNGAAGVTGTLVNGTQYAVSLTATNSVGTGSASNSVNATPAPDPFAAPTGFVATPGPKKVDLSWTAPTGETQTRTGYSLVVKDATNTPITGSPFSIGAGATTFSVTGLTAGASYTFPLPAPCALPPTSNRCAG